MNNILYVYLNQYLVGKLMNERGQLSFTYGHEYYVQKHQPLSASLPLQVEPFDHKTTSPFFSGLLPDEPIRSRLAKYLRLSPANTFGLLKAIGGECAGAISFFPEAHTLDSKSTYQYKTLSNKDAHAILCSLPKHPLLAGDEGIRISGAGAQDKLMIAFVDGQVAIPLENTPSTHIIKPAIQGLEDTVFNEYFCMRLAHKVGLNVPNVDVLWLEETPYYLIERYDRVNKRSDNIIRLHQEDFCQALDIAPEIKYENEGGPSLPDCFGFLDSRILQGKMAGVTKLHLLDAAIFNFIIGNGDAHGKNFSILYTDHGEQLAPLYDLLCTLVYDNPLKAKMAMKIDSKYKFNSVHLRHFEQLGESIGFKATLIRKRMDSLTLKILDNAIQLKDQLNQDTHYTSVIYEKIIDVIQTNLRKIQVRLENMEAHQP